MARNYGKVFRELRTARNILSKEVVGDHFSAAQLSRFETGKTELTAEKLFYILEKINIDVSDFLFFVGDNYLNANLNFQNEMEQFRSYLNASELKKMIQKKEQLAFENPEEQQLNQLHLSTYRCILSLFDPDYQACEEDAHRVTDYLLSVDQWKFFELLVFNYVFPTLTLDLSMTLLKEILSQPELFQNNWKNKRMILRMLVNCGLFYLNQNHIQKTEFVLHFLSSNFTDTNLLFEKSNYLFLRGMYTLQTGSRKEGVQKIKKAFFICDHLQAKHLTTYFLNYIYTYGRFTAI